MVVGAGAATRQFIGTCDTAGVTHVTTLTEDCKNTCIHLYRENTLWKRRRLT